MLKSILMEAKRLKYPKIKWGTDWKHFQDGIYELMHKVKPERMKPDFGGRNLPSSWYDRDVDVKDLRDWDEISDRAIVNVMKAQGAKILTYAQFDGPHYVLEKPYYTLIFKPASTRDRLKYERESVYCRIVWYGTPPPVTLKRKMTKRSEAF